MALYVLPNGNGIVPLDTQANTPHTDTSRMFASAWGAANHSDAPPVTPFKKQMEAEHIYATRDIFENGWKVSGLTPCGIRAIYTIDLGPK
jgi:hypothetical protein